MPGRNVTPDLRTILFVRFSSIGDVVMTTAVLRALKHSFPSARIEYLVREDCAPIVAQCPFVDRVISFPRKEGLRGLLALAASLRQQRYDLVYDAHRSLRSRILLPLLKARYKVVFHRGYVARFLVLVAKLPLLAHARRMLERYHDPVARFGVRYDGGGPELRPSAQMNASAISKFPALARSDRRRIGLAPSAAWPGKRWPVDRFRAVASTLLQTDPSLDVVLFGGPGDAFCREVVEGLDPARVIYTQGGLALGETLGALECVDAVVSNDTGLLHMADALGKPAVAIFGPTGRELGCLPHNARTQILERQLWCRPCSKNGQAPCIRGQRVCLDRISVDEVLAAARLVLAPKRAGT